MVRYIYIKLYFCNRKEVHVLKIDELVMITKVIEEDLIKLVNIAPVIVSIEATDEIRDHRGNVNCVLFNQ